MTVKEMLEHLDGAGLTVTGWTEMASALAQVGLTLESNLNEPQWTDCETVEELAINILNDAGLDAHLYHTGGGIMVAEVHSQTIAGRTVWVTDSEGEEGGPFLVGAYLEPGGQEWNELLSGACSADDLPAHVRRALTQST